MFGIGIQSKHVRMPDNAKHTGPAVEAHYQLLRSLALTIEKFPENHNFTVGDRIGVLALEVLEANTEGTNVQNDRQSGVQNDIGAHYRDAK
jgi:hypothetical protein